MSNSSLLVYPRVVIVDDTDPGIQYGPGWFSVQNSSTPPAGQIGITPYQETVHGLDGPGNFSYSFTGGE